MTICGATIQFESVGQWYRRDPFECDGSPRILESFRWQRESFPMVRSFEFQFLLFQEEFVVADFVRIDRSIVQQFNQASHRKRDEANFEVSHEMSRVRFRLLRLI